MTLLHTYDEPDDVYISRRLVDLKEYYGVAAVEYVINGLGTVDITLVRHIENLRDTYGAVGVLYNWLHIRNYEEAV